MPSTAEGRCAIGGRGYQRGRSVTPAFLPPRSTTSSAASPFSSPKFTACSR